MTSVKEAFENPDVAQGEFYSAQRIRYREVEPNRFLPDAMKGDLGSEIVSDTLSQFDTYDPYNETIKNKFTASGINELLKGQANTTDQETYCRGFVGASDLNRLMAEQQSNSPIRCGWRYKRSPEGGIPQVSQGALGTIKGPLNAQNDPLGSGVQWIWDLKKAKEMHARNFRATLPATATGLTVAQQSFPNTAYCSQTNTFISVDENGRPLPGYTCGTTSIVRTAQNFPQPAQTSATRMMAANTQILSDCMRPGNNPSFGRDCLLMAVKQNGCSKDGAIYQAIEGSSPTATNYLGFLQNQPSFMTYQSKQGDNKITEELFMKERGSWDMATREIQKLQRFTQTAQDPFVKVAAEDLCIKAGKFEEHNFCNDLADSTSIVGVDLKCLQNYWQEKNGKPAGLLYPRTANSLSSQLGTITTWGQYRRAVDDLKNKLNSTNPIEQRTAMNNFLGVSVTTAIFSPLNLDNLAQQPSIGGQALVFWVDAKDAGTLTIDQNNRVRGWGDKSGRINDATQLTMSQRPVYRQEAFPGIEFTGNQFLPIPNGSLMVSGNFTVFVVEKRKSSAADNYFLGGQTQAVNANLILGYRSTNSATMAYWGNDKDIRVPNFQMSSEPARVWSFEKTSTGRQIFINGSLAGSDTNVANIRSWNGASIGRYLNYGYRGMIYEILIFNPGLTVDKRQKIEGYLAHKWGLSGNLPVDHPFKASSP